MFAQRDFDSQNLNAIICSCAPGYMYMYMHVYTVTVYIYLKACVCVVLCCVVLCCAIYVVLCCAIYVVLCCAMICCVVLLSFLSLYGPKCHNNTCTCTFYMLHVYTCTQIQKMVISGGDFKPDTLKTREMVSLLLDDEEMESRCKLTPVCVVGLIYIRVVCQGSDVC